MSFSPALPKPSPGASILVVDDEEMVRQVLSETLTREGYQVSAAADAFQALELLGRTQFSVILSDNHMPRMHGLDLLARAREIQPHATRILITGVVDLETVLDAINRGELYRFIIKPWVREELLATLKNAVQRFDLILQNDALLAETRKLNAQLGQANRELEQQLRREVEQNRELEQLNRTLAGNLQRSIELCVKTVQTYYPSLGSRARSVHQLCKAMSVALKLSVPECTTLEIAAQLHDIGLLGVPRELIKKWQRHPGSLGDAELALIRHHPIVGQELVGFSDQLEAVGQVIRAHHERWDGTGYPDHLSGENIPWLARLLSVAVQYIDLSASDDQALLAVKKLAGTGLDPEAVRVFMRCGAGEFVTRVQREVLLHELQPGMVLARGVYTANGLLLFPEGQSLSSTFIDKLRNHHRVNPIRQSMLVYC